MNKEIKDLIKEKQLKEVLYGIEYISKVKNNDDATCNLTVKNCQLLLDYITNLEQEKQEMKNGWQQEVYNKDEILNRWYETQGRIDKAIEYIGNGNIGIPRKTRDKFIAILKGEDKGE